MRQLEGVADDLSRQLGIAGWIQMGLKPTGGDLFCKRSATTELLISTRRKNPKLIVLRLRCRWLQEAFKGEHILINRTGLLHCYCIAEIHPKNNLIHASTSHGNEREQTFKYLVRMTCSCNQLSELVLTASSFALFAWPRLRLMCDH